ncbi:hypothetical protein [Acinetobacter sp. CFCC 10889]|uniref:hypothetical protein n=1 Tax=Acinetobacter sp. CFCC 10889 TaxID=1775557 RepID=UPI000DD0721A|nr:hypothetical protein [Acinetobacter sp. CFCC 10889]
MPSNFDPDKFRQEILKGGFGKDLKQRTAEDRQQRKLAEEERESKADKKGSKPTFLRPQDISGDYDFKRALQTTLGMPEGMVRTLTRADLEAFKHNIETIAKQYKGGITVEQVIAFSRQDDIDRANQQIHVAHPARRKAGLVHFITNASAESKSRFHHVNVEFQSFNELSLQPKDVSQYAVKNKLSLGHVKFECDCGRFKYWYRYINTVGNTVLGRKEGGFPKIRNPNLTGIACKHILRVMHWIKSGHGQRYLTQAIQNERTRQVGARYRQDKQGLAESIAQQIAKVGSKRSEIKPRLQHELNKLEQKRKQREQLQKRTLQRQKDLLERSKNKQTKQQSLTRYKALLNQGVITDAEYQVLVQNLGK